MQLLANAIGPGLGLWLWEKHNVWGLFGAVAVASLLALLLLRKFNFQRDPEGAYHTFPAGKLQKPVI